jgi:hypothetical protein
MMQDFAFKADGKTFHIPMLQLTNPRKINGKVTKSYAAADESA